MRSEMPSTSMVLPRNTGMMHTAPVSSSLRRAMAISFLTHSERTELGEMSTMSRP